MPVTRTDDSCVTSSAAFHVSSETSFLKTTHCRYPLPSRMIGNCSLPDVRLLYSQPLTMTFVPTRPGRSLMRAVVIKDGDYIGCAVTRLRGIDHRVTPQPQPRNRLKQLQKHP